VKKTASILLITLIITSICYNLLAYYVVFANQKEQSWVEKIQNSPDTAFQVIKLNATLYSFIEDSDLQQVNETVVIDQKVYHIFKKQIKDNVLNLYYLGDENQTAIDVSLKKLMDADSSSDKMPLKKLLNNISKDYITSYGYKLVVFELDTISNPAIFENPTNSLLKGFSAINIPPPEFI
jgi:hypothetical protein